MLMLATGVSSFLTHGGWIFYQFGKNHVSWLLLSFFRKSGDVFWTQTVSLCCCGCSCQPFCFGKTASLRGFKFCHLLCSSGAAPLLAFAEEFISVRRFISPPHLLQLYQHLLFLAPFPAFIFPLLIFTVLHSASTCYQVQLAHSPVSF